MSRWGGRYDHMIVLDADSLIDAPTLQQLVQAMQTDPRLGILQTAPQLIGAKSFSPCCNSPPVSMAPSPAWTQRMVGRQCNHQHTTPLFAWLRSGHVLSGLSKLGWPQVFRRLHLVHDFVEGETR